MRKMWKEKMVDGVGVMRTFSQGLPMYAYVYMCNHGSEPLPYS